jgi:hypothetical protein
MRELLQQTAAAARLIETDLRSLGNIPQEGRLPRSSQVVPFSLIRGTRGYLEKVVHQINGSYENGWFDSCAVMARRLLETLIVEVFEKYGLAGRIQDAKGDFLHLGDLVVRCLNEPAWNLSRNTKRALPRLKDIGDRSAHSRRYNAHKSDVDAIVPDLRITVQELVYLAGLK